MKESSPPSLTKKRPHHANVCRVLCPRVSVLFVMEEGKKKKKQKKVAKSQQAMAAKVNTSTELGHKDFKILR